MEESHDLRSWNISIHAPREGGDGVKLERLQTRSISIHAPREGGDQVYMTF